MTMQRVTLADEMAAASLTWRNIESSPIEESFVSDPATGAPVTVWDLHPDAHAVLPEREVARLHALIEHGDGATCEGNGCTEPVGFALHEDDEAPSGGGLVWQWSTLVTLPTGRVLAVCESCSPSNVYADPVAPGSQAHSAPAGMSVSAVGTTRWLRSDSDTCGCCDGPHVHAFLFDLPDDAPGAKLHSDSAPRVEAMAHNFVRQAPEGARIRVTFEVLDGPAGAAPEGGEDPADLWRRTSLTAAREWPS